LAVPAPGRQREWKSGRLEKEVLQMGKSLSCRGVGADCSFTACASTEEELFAKVKEHAKTDHNMSEIPADLYAKARSAVRDVQQC
jgi:predicted small metal-binding protein